MNHDALLKGLSDPGATWVEESFAQFEKMACQVVLLSCEGFSAIEAKDIARLKSLLKGSEVEIVFSPHVGAIGFPSGWQQTVKEGSAETFPEYLAKDGPPR